MVQERYDEFQKQVNDFIQEWNSPSPTILVKTSGSTGTPNVLKVEKSRMVASAQMTCDFLKIKPGNSILLCMPLDYIAGKMVVVRALVRKLKLIVVPPTGHPYASLHEVPDFAAMVPLQVYNTLKIEREANILKQTKNLLIGGGAISPELTQMLHNFPNHVWSTYGMTETLSHIALRKINGNDASAWYSPFPHIQLKLTDDKCLIINAPELNPCELVTHDCAELLPDGRFRIIGRKDNIICSGGIKIQIEEVEQKLSEILPIPFQITAISDPKYGEVLTLLYEENIKIPSLNIPHLCKNRLPAFWVPKHYIKIKKLPLTETGKPARSIARLLAKQHLHLHNDSET